LLDFRIRVRKTLEERAQRQAEDEYATRVVDEVVSGATVRFPPALLEQEVHEMLHDMDRRLQGQRLTLADYLKIENKTEKELEDELKPQAEKRLRRALILGKVVEVEALEVEDPDIDQELDRVVAPLKEQSTQFRKALDSPAGRRRIALDLLTDKAVKLLTQIARGQAPVGPVLSAEVEKTEVLQAVEEVSEDVPAETSEADPSNEE